MTSNPIIRINDPGSRSHGAYGHLFECDEVECGDIHVVLDNGVTIIFYVGNKKTMNIVEIQPGVYGL